MKKEIKDKKEEKIEEKKEVKETSEQLEKRITIYAYFIIGIIAIILIVVIGYLIWNQFDSHFTYQGMNFEKITKNNERVYSTGFVTKSMFNGTYYINNRTFYLRNNPKYLQLDKKIEGKVPIIANRDVYVSIEEPLPNCNDRVRSLFDLSASLVNYGLKIKGVVTNQSVLNQSYSEITCANSTINTVIIIGQGNYTGYEQVKDNCYKITFKECKDMNRATEGFTLKLLERMADTLGLNKK